MAAAALRGIVRFEFPPDALSHRESMGRVFGGSVELKRHVSPHVRGSGFEVLQQTRHERRWNVAVRAGVLNPEPI